MSAIVEFDPSSSHSGSSNRSDISLFGVVWGDCGGGRSQISNFDPESIGCVKTLAPSVSANLSMRINEMGLARPEIPQLPPGFADGARTSETAAIA
jgi:hypothetical protein